VAEFGQLKEAIQQIAARMRNQFSPLVKKRKIQVEQSYGRNRTRAVEEEIGVPDGMIGHLTRHWGGNVHDGYVLDVTSRSLEKELDRANTEPKKEEKIPGDRKIGKRFWCIGLSPWSQEG
jgi:hypothetical protein